MQRIPGPTDLSRRFQTIIDGTNNRQVSVPPGPLRRFGCNSDQPAANKAVKTPRDHAVDNAHEAKEWIAKSVDALEGELEFFDMLKLISKTPDHELAEHLVRDPPTRSDAKQRSVFNALREHFHVSANMAKNNSLDISTYDSDTTVWAIKTIRSRLKAASKVLGKPSNFIDSPVDKANPDSGALAFVNQSGKWHIYITPVYSERHKPQGSDIEYGPYGPLTKVHSLIHEAIHFIGFTDRERYRGITKDNDGKNLYDTQSADEAMENADSYAYFALHMAKKINRQIKMQE